MAQPHHLLAAERFAPPDNSYTLDVPVIIIRQISLQEALGVQEHQEEALVKACRS